MQRSLLFACALVLLPCSAHAQFRSTTERSRMEVGFDTGYGGGSEGGFAELAIDWRLWAPFGLGAIVRTGLASNVFSNAFAADFGVGTRFDLVRGTQGGLQWVFGAGASIAYGPFHGDVTAFGGFALSGLEFWHRNFFAGAGASAHVLWTENYGQEGGRPEPIWTLSPTLRVGGDWGL